MSAATPGEAAFEAHRDKLGGVRPWSDVRDPEREVWEATGQAAIDAFLAGDSVSAGSIREALAAREPQAAPGASAFLQLADDWDKLADENDDGGIKSGEPEWNYRANELRSCAASLRLLAGQAPDTPQPAPKLAAVVLAEVLTWIENPAIMRPGPEVIAEWRKRAGLPS